MQINLYRANVGATAAEAAGVGEMGEFFAAQVRRDDAADRALVGRAVTVTADGFVNRAGVQARAATDAVERVALLGVGE